MYTKLTDLKCFSLFPTYIEPVSQPQLVMLRPNKSVLKKALKKLPKELPKNLPKELPKEFTKKFTKEFIKKRCIT